VIPPRLVGNNGAARSHPTGFVTSGRPYFNPPCSTLPSCSSSCTSLFSIKHHGRSKGIFFPFLGTGYSIPPFLLATKKLFGLVNRYSVPPSLPRKGWAGTCQRSPKDGRPPPLFAISRPSIVLRNKSCVPPKEKLASVLPLKLRTPPRNLPTMQALLFICIPSIVSLEKKRFFFPPNDNRAFTRGSFSPSFGSRT